MPRLLALLLLALTAAEDLYQHRKPKESLALLDLKSTDPATQFLIARNYILLHDLKKATEVLTELTDKYPNSVYFDWLGRVYGQRAEEANPFSAAGLAGKTRQAFERAVELDGNNRDALSDLFDYYLDAPGIMGGSVDKANTIAEKNLKLNPQEGLLEKAKLADKRKDFKSAESFYRAAVQKAPDGPGYYADLARFLQRQNRTDEADAVFAEAFRKIPKSPQLWFDRAKFLVKNKRNSAEAKDLLNRVLQAPLTVDDPSPEEAKSLLQQIS